MDGSDDYFSDDIIFDDQALAVLDREEQKYLTQVTQHTILPPAALQVLSKRNTATNGSIGRGIEKRLELVDEIEDLPEIILEDDGSYRVHGASRGRAPASMAFNNANLGQNVIEKGVASTEGFAHRSGSVQQRAVLPAHSRDVSAISEHDTHRRPVHSIQGSSQSQSSLGKRSRSAFDAPLAPVASAVQNVSSHDFLRSTHTEMSLGKRARSSVDAQVNTSTLINTTPPSFISVEDDTLHPLTKKVEELQKMLQELGQENAKIQAALQAAEDAKIAKVGEVAVLRRAIEKTAQDHIAYVNNLKAAKDQADAKQAQMQKSMREEVERMKTQFIFKQHEMETLNRKLPSSVRPPRILKEPPSTPISLPSQIRGWGQSTPSVGPTAFTEANAQPRPSEFQGNAPKVLHKSPEKAKKLNALPGFHNAFATSTPLRPSQRRSNKAKQRKFGATQIHSAPSPSAFHIPASPPSSPIQNPRPGTSHLLNPLDEPVSLPSPDVYGDLDMVVDDDETMLVEEVEDEADPIQSFIWKIEFNRVMLTETLHPLTTPSLQTIIKAVATIDLPLDMAQKYSAVCSRIFETISTTYKNDDIEKAFTDISHSLSTVIPVMSDAELHLPLAALLGLLTALCYALPYFNSALLADSQDGNDDPDILIRVCEIIQNHLETSTNHEHKETLSTEIVSLLEALCYNIRDEVVQKLAFMPRAYASLLALLHNYQPSWLLNRSVRLLILLATHVPLCRTLVLVIDSDLPHVGQAATLGRSPLVERLCYHLTDTNRRDLESHELKTSILTFFALLSHSELEVHSALVGSAFFIPTIIVFLSQLTTPIWDDNEELLNAPPESITLAIRTLNQALFLLHHLIFNTTPTFNLKQKLSSVNGIRHFNGLTHTFMVTFGRLCYADTPGWVNQEGSRELVLLTDMAREILDLVVDGPECDNIWQAYHIEPDSSSQTDEEEMEANFLGEP